MKKIMIFTALLLTTAVAWAENFTVSSPDKRLEVTINVEQGRMTYAVTYDKQQVLANSALGLKANHADFTQGLRLAGKPVEGQVVKDYEMTRTKKSKFHYEANKLDVNVLSQNDMPMTVTFQVSNNDVAFRYTLGRNAKKNNPKAIIIKEEASAFLFPQTTTTFICPQITPMTGWERTKPSYEEEYTPDAPITKKSQFGVGYTFPCLFKLAAQPKNDKDKQASNLWALVSETGVTGQYCGARLSDYDTQKGYTIAYPQKGEGNGFGSEWAAISLPGSTPWRTITIGNSLKPIVETTVHFDVVDPLYEPSKEYKPARYTWSWLVWQDNSMNYDDQVLTIDMAAKMGYEAVLVDAEWDRAIGRKRMGELAKYAKSKGVSLMLWYNSNGPENDAPQTPRDIMSNSIARKADMKWMKEIGVIGIKVDFFGGDKQHTMQLYEDILSDANDYGLEVIFHGCTLPRGWERMYPNYVGSEAALASENVYFSEHHAKAESFELTMHPFARNAVGSFDWGGVMMNRWMSRDNKSRHQRYTGDIFEMATAITNQQSVNCVAIYPNATDHLKDFVMDFLRQIPTQWNDVQFIDGYPTRYAVIARRAGDKWYVGGINATREPLTLKLNLPMFAGQTVDYYYDMPKAKGATHMEPALRQLKVSKNGEAKVTIQPDGGIIIK